VRDGRVDFNGDYLGGQFAQQCRHVAGARADLEYLVLGAYPRVVEDLGDGIGRWNTAAQYHGGVAHFDEVIARKRAHGLAHPRTGGVFQVVHDVWKFPGTMATLGICGFSVLS
jgi:hypothetical protein